MSAGVQLTRRRSRCPPRPSNAHARGARDSGKTSLLFQCACHLASSGKHVVILCDQAGLDQAPPLLPPGADASSAALQRISFKCVLSPVSVSMWGPLAGHSIARPAHPLCCSSAAHLA
jgi:hypothetical protein